MTSQAADGTPAIERCTAIRPNLFWRFCRSLIRNLCVFWLDYRARGQELAPGGGALILANHESFLDPLLVALPLEPPVSYLARHSLFAVPVLGGILRLTYVMPINRDSASSASIREAVRRIREGYLVGIFPEGTRSIDGQLGELKPGFIALLRHAQAPIVPVGVAGAGDTLPRGAKWLRRGRIRVAFGPPIEWKELEPLTERGHETALLDYVRDRMLAVRQQAADWRNAVG